MAIDLTKYVDITSGVGGADQVALRELIARIFTTNILAPTKTLIEFTDLDSVGIYFGYTSEEYKRAQFYFGWVSKMITQAKKISFARFADADTAPLIFGAVDDYLLGDFTPITTGAFSLTLGAITEVITAIDFSADLSLTDMATNLQTVIQAANIDPLFSAATVEYDAIRKSFNLVAGTVGAAVVVVADAGSGVEIAGLIGWLNTGTILSDGVAEESITETLSESAAASNNFGSFCFIPAFALEDIVEAATWAQAQNVRYQFHAAVLEADAATTEAAVKNIGATGITVKSPTVTDEYPEMIPMTILAATDYARRNTNQNYMYQRFIQTPTITETQNSNAMDVLRINYYGETQQAGRFISFYQRGVLMGLTTDPLDMNTFANEQWFKDAAGVALLNMLLALAAIPANDSGRGLIIGNLQETIGQALFNGTFSVGKTITPTQKAYISEVTGDPDAWRQIQVTGYWLDAKIIPDTLNPGQFKASYVLLYGKADVIRKVDGVHTLI
jgi:hypothetical protein